MHRSRNDKAMMLVEVVLERERDRGQTLLDCGLIINMRVL